MKTVTLFLSVVAFCMFSSFTENEACKYSGSNMGYVISQTEQAINTDDLNKAKYLAYKALNAIYKSREQLADCGCEHAEVTIEETHHHLKLAVESKSINGARILLTEALYKAKASLKAIEKYDLEQKADTSKDLAMNNAKFEDEVIDINMARLDESPLHAMIDRSLQKYEASLATVVDSLSCREARAYAEKVFEHCEQQLLQSDLTEGKKYYNLRTQEITAEALKRLEGCETSK